VCIDARIPGGTAGGVEQAIVGLASGLSRLAPDGATYQFVVVAGEEEWLEPYITGACRLLRVRAEATVGLKRLVRARLPLLRRAWHSLSPFAGRLLVPVPRSDGAVEAAGAHVVHFPLQRAFMTSVPSIYQPWDLQHLYLPELHSRRDRLARSTWFRAFAAQASLVVAPTEWMKRDFVRNLGVPEEKVAVISPAPVLDAYPQPGPRDLARTTRALALSEAFLFYPAQTWPHKNHLGLLEALALLRDRGMRVPLVCSGHRNEFFPTIDRRIGELALRDQVRFLGFVEPLELQCLYRLCRAMVFPTMFEGWGMPLMEAFLAGVPTACARVTSLPEQAGDAAILFDPGRPDEIAAAIERLWIDAALRRRLRERGRDRSAGVTWDTTARIFRAHYRRLAGQALDEDDRRVLVKAPRF
jgi:glycosyltransferase involved in cell wall biosynthesis